MDAMFWKALALFAMTSSIGWFAVLLAASAQRYQRKKDEAERARATGTIVEYVSPGHGSGWKPVVEFTADGQLLRLQSEFILDREQHPVGESVEVLYNADDPTRFHMETDGAMRKYRRGTMRFGVIWILCSAAFVVALWMLVGGGRLDIEGFVRDLRQGRISVGAPKEEDKSTRSGDYQYTAQGDLYATITKYTGSEATLTVPTMVDLHVVTGFSASAFSRNRQLAALTVPGSVQSVPMGAFAGCVSLSDVTLCEGVTTIGAQAFTFCMSLTDVTLPASLTHIANDAFAADCEAVFHVVQGSKAEQFCRDKGYKIDYVDVANAG